MFVFSSTNVWFGGIGFRILRKNRRIVHEMKAEVEEFVKFEIEVEAGLEQARIKEEPGKVELVVAEKTSSLDLSIQTIVSEEEYYAA